MNINEVIHQARLNGVYSVLRKAQAVHNEFETSCVGSGNCCKIGLQIHLSECWYIAKSLRQKYWLMAESQGQGVAETWFNDTVNALIEALRDDSWDGETNETDRHCVFYDDGCTIYESRPMACRAYGVIAPVQEGVCPRKRLPDGNHELLWDDGVQKTINEFDSIVKKWGEDHPDLDYTIYMAAGVLKFMLDPEEFSKIIADTDEKFWMAKKGYNHRIKRDSWTSVSIRTN